MTDVSESLRLTAQRAQPGEKAAVDLLVEHGYWLTDPEFVANCVYSGPYGTVIDWDEAEEFIDHTELWNPEDVVLRVAVALGNSNLGLERVQGDVRDLLAKAFTTALGPGGHV